MRWLRDLMALLLGAPRRRPQGWRVIVAPVLPAVEETVTWLSDRGAYEMSLWRGPDGLVRGVWVCR